LIVRAIPAAESASWQGNTLSQKENRLWKLQVVLTKNSKKGMLAMTLKEINSALAEKRREHYPPDERAGFNYGKAICSMIESLAINEDDFIRGMMKPLTSRQKYVEAQRAKAHNEENKRLQMQAGGGQ
jgi:hypothetical protein